VSTKVVTGIVRLSYANVWEPKAIEGQEAKYSVCLLIPKTDKKTLSDIKAAVNEAKQAGIKDKWKGKCPQNLKTPIHDGDGDKPNGGAYGEECQGHFVVNCNSRQKPGIVDKDRNTILDQSEVYSGCYARVSINFYPYDTSGNKGIGCGLNNIQKIKDGESLSGRSRAEEDFDRYEDNDAEDDFLSDDDDDMPF
jgi:hypothetical protein